MVFLKSLKTFCPIPIISKQGRKLFLNELLAIKNEFENWYLPKEAWFWNLSKVDCVSKRFQILLNIQLYIQEVSKDCNLQPPSPSQGQKPSVHSITKQKLIFLLNDVMNIYQSFHMSLNTKMMRQIQQKQDLLNLITPFGKTRQLVSKFLKRFSTKVSVH